MRLSGRLSRPMPGGMRGVTLIELMIVVVIVGILAAIAYPSYQRQVQQTRRTDGRTILLEVAQRLERCFTRYNSYTDAACAVDGDLEDADNITSAEGWYVITNGNRAATTFRLEAAPQGAQAADARCATLRVTHTGARDATGTTPADCW